MEDKLVLKLRPDLICTKKLCYVCAVVYGTVARLAETLPGPPQVVNLEPSSLSDIFDDIRRVAEACDVPQRAHEVIAKLSARVEAVQRRASHNAYWPRCLLVGWGGPPLFSGRWGPGLVE